MSDAESEAWEDAVKDLLEQEDEATNTRLQDLVKPPDRDEMPRSASMHAKSPHELLPKPML